MVGREFEPSISRDAQTGSWVAEGFSNAQNAWAKHKQTLHEQSRFWDALAAHHAAIEDNYLDLASLRRIIHEVRSPALVVGAGQGLLVAELRSKGLQCDGVDFSSEMIRHAQSRRGLEIIQADASTLPIADGTYETIIYATGVIDFNGDEEAVRSILTEGRRVVKPGGRIFVGFYRLSPALEHFLKNVGLLSDFVLLHRQSLEAYLLTPVQMFRWVMRKARTGWLGHCGPDGSFGGIWIHSRENNYPQNAEHHPQNGEFPGIHRDRSGNPALSK